MNDTETEHWLAWVALSGGGVAIVVCWVLVCALGPKLLENSRSDVVFGLGLVLNRLYCRLVHRVELSGVDNLPKLGKGGRIGGAGGPLILIGNHASGADPMLVQSASRLDISWMMHRSMMLPSLDWFWAWMRIIPVGPGESNSARTAIKRLEAGEVVGIFPEGRIIRCAPGDERIGTFEPGVGLIVSRSRAPVLMCVIEGGPRAETAFGSLFRRSRSHVRFLPVIDYSSTELSASEIARDLERRMIAETGWRASGTLEPPCPR